jgi:hypothetical protein
VWAGVSTSRVSSSSCIMPWEGSERACVNINWSEALTGRASEGGLFGSFFRLGFYNVRDPQVKSAGAYYGQEWHVVAQVA